MKNKLKTLIFAIVFLDVIFIGLYGYNKFFYIESANYSSREKVERNDVHIEYVNIFYGDKIDDNVIEDVSGKKVFIYDENENFKFISINQGIREKILNMDYFVSFTKLKKSIINENVEFIYLINEKMSEKKNRELITIQNKFDINIAFVHDDYLIRNFKLPDCKCGFVVLIDGNNKVRLASHSLSNDLLRRIINNELNKQIIDKINRGLTNGKQIQ